MSAAWSKKKVTVIAPDWTDENLKAYRWCISNGIKITPWAYSSERDNYYWWIDVYNYDLKPKTGPNPDQI